MEEKKLLYRIILINIIFIIQAFAEEGFLLSRDVMAIAIQQAQEIQKESSKLINKHPIGNVFEDQSSKKCCPSQSLNGKANANKGCVKNIDPHLKQQDKATQIFVFVSFSMPETSLISLFQETSIHNAVLVMRGLVDDSFVKTAQKLQNLGVTVDNNPELFVTHKVSTVPTFILIKDGHPVYTLKGNVSLEFATQKLKDQIAESQSLVNQRVEVIP